MKNFLSGAALTMFPDVRRGRPFSAAVRLPLGTARQPGGMGHCGATGLDPPPPRGTRAAAPSVLGGGEEDAALRAHLRGCCPSPGAFQPRRSLRLDVKAQPGREETGSAAGAGKKAAPEPGCCSPFPTPSYPIAPAAITLFPFAFLPPKAVPHARPWMVGQTNK